MPRSAHLLSQKVTEAFLIGDSASTRELRAEIARAAQFSSSVLITGPNGTGKELIARAIHACSPRSEQQFIPVDCAALVGSLFASHMFGHEKGAFTGANYASMGCFRAADGGTLFLDEIGDMDLDLQSKLLRVLQERVVVSVGAVEGTPVDVRLIAATNRELRDDVSAGLFREDLYYRLNVVLLETVALSQRIEDIPPLCTHFLRSFYEEQGFPLKRLRPDAVAALQGYHWPGNVRQLKNVLERVVIQSFDDVIDAADIFQVLQRERQAAEPIDPAILPQQASSGREEGIEPLHDPSAAIAEARLARHEQEDWLTLAELERHHIERTLQFTFYNQSAAARLLGITPRVLSGKIKRYGIDISASRRGRPPKHRRPKADH